MKVAVVCLFVAVALLQGARADIVNLGSCSFAGDATAVVTGAVTVVGNVCSNIIATLGVTGCVGLLQGVLSQLTGSLALSSLICVTDFKAYIDAVVAALVSVGVVVRVASGAIELVAGATVAASAVIAALTGIAGGVIGGLILGVSATVNAALITAVNTLLGLVGSVVGTVSCLTSTCLSA